MSLVLWGDLLQFCVRLGVVAQAEPTLGGGEVVAVGRLQGLRFQLAIHHKSPGLKSWQGCLPPGKIAAMPVKAKSSPHNPHSVCQGHNVTPRIVPSIIGSVQPQALHYTIK